MKTAEELREELDKATETLQRLTSQFEEIATTRIPPTIQDAIKERWELEVQGLTLQFLTAYPRHVQEIDHRRVIPLGRAIQLLEGYESAAIRHSTRGLIGSIFAQLNKRIKFLLIADQTTAIVHQLVSDYLKRRTWREIMSDLAAIGALLDSVKIYVALFGLIFVRLSLGALAVEQFSVGAVGLMELRDQFSEKMRAKALPQRAVPRYRRRKLTRL